jgi:hypothetical protein
VGSRGGAGQEGWRWGSPRRSGDGGVAVSNGGGVALVIVDVRGGVLQHRCGRGKRDLAPIRGMAKLGGRSPEGGKTAAALGKI